MTRRNSTTKTPRAQGTNRARQSSKKPVITLQSKDWRSRQSTIEVKADESAETVQAIQELLDTPDGEAFAAFWNAQMIDPEEAADLFRDAYIGEYETVAHYACEVVSQCCDIDNLPRILRYHIDYDGIARDMQLEGSIWIASARNGDVFIYSVS